MVTGLIVSHCATAGQQIPRRRLPIGAFVACNKRLNLVLPLLPKHRAGAVQQAATGFYQRPQHLQELRLEGGQLGDIAGPAQPAHVRVAAHNAGKGAKYTKTRRPVVLAYYEEYATRSEAMRREAAIKKLTKKEKEAMAVLGRTELPVDDET